jgi:hypothetical protein
MCAHTSRPHGHDGAQAEGAVLEARCDGLAALQERHLGLDVSHAPQPDLRNGLQGGRDRP